MVIENHQKEFSVSQVAAMCDVNRGTVGYWIRSQKLFALRAGKDYSIPVEELLLFLKSKGRQLPATIAPKQSFLPLFGISQACWQYWQSHGQNKSCEGCIVYKKQIELCFIAKDATPEYYPRPCGDCQYYNSVYLPRIQFIHQLNVPAFVYKDLYIIGGNNKFSDLCGYEEKELISMGIERIVHSDSLETVIYNGKKRALDESSAPMTYNYYVKSKENGKLEVCASVYSLSEPSGTFLVVWGRAYPK